MNERVLEIAKQAGLKFPSEATLSPAEIKFARLIVRECIGIAQDRSAFYWEPPNNVNHTINKIRQHFGVEE